MKYLKWGVLGCVFSLFVALIGCGAAIDEDSDTIDCGSICERYSDCDADYDVDACSDRCAADASASEDRQHRLRVCDECIGARACTEGPFACMADCAGIVP